VPFERSSIEVQSIECCGWACLCLVAWCVTEPIFRFAQAIFRANLFTYKYPAFQTPVIHIYSHMKMERTGCSGKLALKLQTLVNNPVESILPLYTFKLIYKFQFESYDWQVKMPQRDRSPQNKTVLLQPQNVKEQKSATPFGVPRVH
jgi:hypothetical protein